MKKVEAEAITPKKVKKNTNRWNKNFEIIDPGSNKNCHRNNGFERTILFKNDKEEKFRISIRVESYRPQEYAYLYKWTEKEGFQKIISKAPYEYGIGIPLRDAEETYFDPIIKDLMKIAEHF